MIKEILSVIPTFNKYQLVLLAVQSVLVIWQICSTNNSFKSARKHLDRASEIYKHALIFERATATIETFRDTTFCTCESCKNRECPRKLTRLTIADAVRMGVPIRVDNFMNGCSAYTEEEEGC